MTFLERDGDFSIAVVLDQCWLWREVGSCGDHVDDTRLVGHEREPELAAGFGLGFDRFPGDIPPPAYERAADRLLRRDQSVDIPDSSRRLATLVAARFS